MKTATTWDDLFANYEVFINTDSVPVEAMNDDIRRFAEINNRRYTDVLNDLYEAIWPDGFPADQIPPDMDDYPPQPTGHIVCTDEDFPY